MNLIRAEEIAVKAHKGQVDKGGEEYIHHPWRVMESFRMPEDKMVAILHDVVEDTPVTLEDLKSEGFSSDVIHAVDCMTRGEGESWNKYIERVKGDNIALRVKIADLRDNLNITRLRSLKDIDINSLSMYLSTYHKLIKYERENR